VVTAPRGYELSDQILKGVPYTDQQAAALEGADFIYVKNWSSVRDYGKVLGGHPEWMLTERHLGAAPQAKVMHCLPLRRNVELGDEILDGPRNILTDMAINRTCSAQAVLSEVLKGN
jgi:N-succinyl-L-ornithine transcarbamylase